MRKVFFSFDYGDVWKANVVRNSWALASPADRQAFGFVDAAEREQLKQQGDAAIAEWIREQMHGTSVTVVLMGENTHTSRWVRFEIEESVRLGKGILGIDIRSIADPHSEPPNPFAALLPLIFDPLDSVQVRMDESRKLILVPTLEDGFRTILNQPRLPSYPLSHFCETHDWRCGDGRNNIARWIEDAAVKAGR